jgi:hypothetical protein
MTKYSVNKVVCVKNPKYAITKRFKDEFGIVQRITKEGSKTYYSVKFNSGSVVMFEESEIG